MDPDSILVYIDIETDTIRASKLLQLAAVTEDNNSFSLHINPRCDLPLSCTNVTGLYYYRNNLYKNGRLLPSVSVRKALYEFKKWIFQLNKNNNAPLIEFKSTRVSNTVNLIVSPC